MIDPRNLPPCVFLAGPTASGKTSLAVHLASRMGAEVVSADSMLVYRHMDIGTAKPTLEERRGVAHHLMDVVDPDEHYDAATFRRQALEVLSDLAARRVPAIVAGGTGLYLRSLRWGLAEAPGADMEYRRELENRARREGTQKLHDELRAVDARSAQDIHPNDLVRIQRALEIHHVTGRPASVVRAEHGFSEPTLDALYVVLDVPGPELRERIRTRAESMVQGGLVEEVEALVERGYGPELRPMQALNYRQALSFLGGEYDRDTMVERMSTETWQFSRRQKRWFRGEDGARMMPPVLQEIEEACRAHLEHGFAK